jgi:myxalamid-type polyketide synthase MxaE and MxaD
MLSPEPIAIIGMGCRYPGASNPAQYWRLLRDGIDAVTEIPAGRWEVNAFFDENANTPGKMNTRWGGFLDQIDQFDSHFFKISPREATHVDPQQRLLLEVTWEALEDAGQLPEKLSGSQTGVFIGIMGNDYGDTPMNNPDLVNFYTFPGIARCIAANRLSYFFDFRGPSMAIDSACSSSLVAVHLACKSLWNGESTLAVAGGVNLILSPEGTIWYSKAGLMARDGRCKAFDARADGLVRGEGAGVVVLKPLSKALADGDPILAVIKGGAVNQDGRSNGLTAPNRWAQEAVIREACRQAGISPGEIGYVEAHGTGTALGDPIEVKALGAVLATERPAGDTCALGSVKTNIGHLEAAAGIAGLMKAVLMLKHREIPPSLHFQTPNPHIPFDDLPLSVQQALAPWPRKNGEVFAGVNSFGFGGTNAHVILGAAPETAAALIEAEDTNSSEATAFLLPLSARTPESLHALAGAYRQTLIDAGASISARDLCYTASVRRSQHEHRLALVGHRRAELSERLDTFLSGESHPAISLGHRSNVRRPKLAFVFSGQGPQWWAMGRQLLKEEGVFRAALEQCDELFKRRAGRSLLAEMLADEENSHILQTEVAQPALFALQVGLAALWRSWGIEPDAVVGHSVGEVATAHVAGVLSLADAVDVIFHRSRLMQRATGEGQMAVVELDFEEAARAIAGYEGCLSVAAHNGPRSCVISGDSRALEEVLAQLRRRGLHCQLLRVNYAFHSPQMERFESELKASLAGIAPRRAALPIFSTVSGGAGDCQAFDARYWSQQIQQPVLFAPAVNALLADGYQTFVELGPHPVLTGAIRDCLAERRQEGMTLCSLRRGEDERASLLKSLGRLYTLGCPVAWEQVQAKNGRCVSLPTYQWQRERYWLKEQETRNEAGRLRRKSKQPDSQSTKSAHPLLGRGLASAVQTETYHWETEPDAQRFPYLNDHRVQGAMVLPAAFGVEMALAAMAEVFGTSEVELSELRFEQAVVLGEGEATNLQLVVTREAEGEARFQLFSRAAGQSLQAAWTPHAAGRFLPHTASSNFDERGLSLTEIKRRCDSPLKGEEFYGAMARRGLEYGESFRGVTEVWRGRGEALAHIRLSEKAASEAAASSGAHPALLDNCLQVIAAALPGHAAQNEEETYLPVSFERLRVHRQPRSSEAAWGYARFKGAIDARDEVLEADAVLFGESGEVVLEVSGVRLRRVRGGFRHQLASQQQLTNETRLASSQTTIASWLYQVSWDEDKAFAASASATSRPHKQGHWLIFADDGGVGDALKSRLELLGESCVAVRRGDVYQRTSSDEFQINPERLQDVERLWTEVFGLSRQPVCSGVVHLWSLDSTRSDETTFASLTQDQINGCQSVLKLVQALDGNASAETTRLWIVTGGAQAVGEGDALSAIAQSPVWGLGRVIAQEFASLHCRLVDISNSAPERDAEALVRELLSISDERQVAWRNGVRHVARLEKLSEVVPPPQTRDNFSTPDAPPALQPSPGAKASLVNAESTYLITGGAGGLGLKVARWMVEQGARHLALLGRSNVSSLAQQAVAELEAEGAQVSIMAANVAEPEQLERVLDEIKKTMPPLKGVIHAAGVLDDALLRHLDDERLARVLRPKVQGAWNLHCLTLDDELDFFVLFSSLSAMLGSVGQGNYAAGNAFQDALAHHRHACGLPGLSINWGPWAEVGMAADLCADFAQRGIFGIQPDEGVLVLEQALRERLVQVGAVRVEWPKFVAQFPLLSQDLFLCKVLDEALATVKQSRIEASTQALPAAPAPALVSRLEAALSGEHNGILLAHIQAEVSKVLGLPADQRPDVSHRFFEMGMDSLMIAELSRNLQAAVGKSFPLSILFDHASIEQLAQYLSEHILSLKPEAVASEEAPADEQQVNLVLEKLEQLSDEEALALLAEKLPLD